jgi:NAD(P) transhydrogenase
MLHDTVLVMAGGLIASSGALLSDIMCRGMNRSLLHVLKGGFGVDAASAESGGAVIAGEIKDVQTRQVAELLTSEDVRKVLIVPGYGMAVARCQGVLAEIVDELRKLKKTVEFGIHPVAGRLPGHMNVLLAEADVPYDIVNEMDEVNKHMDQFDVAIVLGANDIVNPSTQEDTSSPIYGMPAIEVWRAKQVVVMKRSMATGYAGVENPLFFKENTRMLFGDAKVTLDGLFKDVLDLKPPLVINEGGLTAQSAAGRGVPSDWRVQEDEEDFPALRSDQMEMTNKKTVGVLSEWRQNARERRVAISPRVVGKLRSAHYTVVMERGAGEKAGWKDADFVKYGAVIAEREEVVKRADIIVKLNIDETTKVIQEATIYPEEGEKIFICLNVAQNQLTPLAQKRLTVFNLSLVPRISRAQKLDTLTSMANIAGYRAVIEAFHLLPRFSRTSITAGGTIAPARVFVIGAGVAGLSAIATAKALGCSVVANDVRAACKDQVESMGAVFVEIPAVTVNEGGEEDKGGYAKEMSSKFLENQKAVYKELVQKADVVICTAMIPGKRAPVLIDAEMVKNMVKDAVIVDMAAAGGGNCVLTKVDELVTVASNNVRIVGRTDFTSDMAQQASDLLGHNFLAFLGLLGSGKDFKIDLDDAIVRQCVVTHDGQVAFPPPPLQTPPPKNSAPSGTTAAIPTRSARVPQEISVFNTEELAVALGVGVLVTLGLTTDAKHVKLMGDFVLSVLVGNFTVASVAPALHTPLISVTNAISGIIVLGGMMQMTGSALSPKVVTAMVSVFFSLINVTGGFAISHRMLEMFKSDSK